MNPVIVIPAYRPQTTLIQLVKELLDKKQKVIVVNDGSGVDYQEIFAEISSFDIPVLEHAVNLGKGQALKTAFNYFLLHDATHSPGIITADADGQHLVSDIIKMVDYFKKHPQALILGARTFGTDTPWRSRFGNRLTCLVFKFLIGQSLQDTQTGLRAIPKTFLKPLLKTTSQGYEFELDMLVLAKQNQQLVLEHPITTVYENNNQSSHFNPLIDSLKIYFVFIRFLFFSIVSGLFDFFAFSLTFLFLQNVLVSETLARIFSGTFNFLLNKELVFKSKQKIYPEALKYSLLCVANLFISYALISSFHYFGMNIFASKLIALIGLFIANFAIQNLLIFKESTPQAYRQST